MKRSAMCILLAASVATLSGCASSVKRPEKAALAPMVNHQKVSAVDVKLADEAKQKLADNTLFDADALKRTVIQKLSAGGCIEPGGASRVDITVTDIRTRSGFAAVMFGFMAGDDHIVGTVAVNDGSTTPSEEFEISASYALGGLAGGQDNARMGYLYDKFAELTANELHCGVATG